MDDDLLARIERAPWYRGQIAHVAEIPASKAVFDEVPLPPVLASYLERSGIALYRHQGEVIRALREGRDVVLTTPTASGKTLAFNLPVLEALAADPDACALYLYPLKALANDQLAKLLDLERETGIPLHPATYDGDTPAGRRAVIKRTSRIILTNPHALHLYLPWHPQWERVFRHLRYVVIDEAHWYRGVFGANVALLLKRLARLLAHYGSHPQVVLSSASVANPVEFARALTGREAVSVSGDAAARGPRRVVFWDALTEPGRSVTSQAARLLALLTSQGVQTLAFTKSRAQAEVLARTAADLGAKGILPYRAGYLPSERREIEGALRDGEIAGVVSTSALEAGIDIGSLDAVILVGFPGSLLSAWQQAGRAGRGTDPSLVFFVPNENALDRYLLRHPEAFLGREREAIVVRSENPRLEAGHLACAAAELPVRTEEVSAREVALLDGLAARGLVAKTSRGYIYRGLKRAHDLVSLDDLSGEAVKLLCCGKLLETMDPLRARRDAYPGAVLLHRGETYVVERLDLESGVAEVRQEAVDYFTRSLRSSTLEVLGTEEAHRTGTVYAGRGRARATETFVGFQTHHADRTISVSPLDLPPHAYETDALFLAFPEGVPGVSEIQLLAALHAAEHALIAIAPLLVLCDREDVGGVSSPFHDQTRAPTILLYDGVEGGAGIAEVLFNSLSRLAQGALRLVSDCPCTDGCPSCLFDPHCGSQNENLDKEGGIEVLRLLSSLPEGAAR